MKVRFKSLPTNTPSLFPEDIFDKIGANDPVRLINELVDNLNIDHIIGEYKGGGTTSFHPRMMIKVLFYAYFNNIYSCRKIEKALGENIHFMWLSGNSKPDYRTINYFRSKRLKNHIHRLFADVTVVLQNLGYVSLNVQYIDGTKIESSANRYSFVWKKSVEKNKLKLEAQIHSVLEDIESQIKEERYESHEKTLPKSIDSRELQDKIAELNHSVAQDNKTGKKLIKKLQHQDLPRLQKYEDQLKILSGRNSYSKTDPDACFMRLKDDHMKNGQLKPAYNAQISTENQFITHYSIHQTPGDTTTLKDHLNSFENQYHKQSKEVVADAGYGSEENYEMMAEKAIEGYVKYNNFHKEQKRSEKNNAFAVQNLYYNEENNFYVCPCGQQMNFIGKGKRISSNGYESQVHYYQAFRCQGCPLRESCHQSQDNRLIEVNYNLNHHRMKARQRLISEKGHYHRSKRPIEVEAVFGQLKSNNKFSRFTLKGLEKVNIEFGLMALAHNLRKLVKNRKLNRKNWLNTLKCKQHMHLFHKYMKIQKYKIAA